MAKIKTPRKKVMFNMSERELCKECGFPEGFCQHTIEEEYRDLCPNTPLSQESVWQLVRTYAISRTGRKRIFNSLNKENHELKNENYRLLKEIQELNNFKKHMEELLINVKMKK